DGGPVTHSFGPDVRLAGELAAPISLSNVVRGHGPLVVVAEVDRVLAGGRSGGASASASVTRVRALRAAVRRIDLRRTHLAVDDDRRAALPATDLGESVVNLLVSD